MMDSAFQMDVLRLLPAVPRAVPLARRQPEGLPLHRREHRLKGTSNIQFNLTTENDDILIMTVPVFIR